MNRYLLLILSILFSTACSEVYVFRFEEQDRDAFERASEQLSPRFSGAIASAEDMPHGGNRWVVKTVPKGYSREGMTFCVKNSKGQTLKGRTFYNKWDGGGEILIGECNSKKDRKQAVMHEIAHAIGVKGHPNDKSIMANDYDPTLTFSEETLKEVDTL